MVDNSFSPQGNDHFTGEAEGAAPGGQQAQGSGQPQNAFAPAPGPGNYPLQGSYPAPGAPMPYYYMPPPPEKKGRRVGVITMALSLIAVGVILILRVFMPGLDYITIARLSPVILILLGIEMLLAASLNKKEKLRYDFLSVFISLLLIGGSLLAAAIPEAILHEIGSVKVANRLAAELDDRTAQALGNQSGHSAYSVEWFVGLEGTDFSNNMSPADLRPEHYVQARVFMPEDFDGPVEFAKECRRMADLLLVEAPHVDYTSFYSARNSEGTDYVGPMLYELRLENRFELANDAGELAELVVVSHWHEPYGSYISGRELEGIQEQEGANALAAA